MDIKLFLFYIVFIVSKYTISQINSVDLFNYTYNDTLPQKFKIEKIMNVKNGNVIIISKNINGKTYCYNLVTNKTKVKKYHKIKKGEFYNLKVFPYYNKDRMLQHIIFNVRLNNSIINVKPNKWRSNVFTTPNLKGLYYIPPDSTQLKNNSSTYKTNQKDVSTPYRFSAKEKDLETGFSYFGQRYYADWLGVWLSVDPMADKYPYQSPYSYCGNRPTMVIDPNGEDEWELNNQGEIVNHTKTKEHDAFYIVDNDGKRIDGKEQKFKYGTIEQAKTQTYAQDGKNVKTYDFYKVRGDKNGTDLFEFVANNTNVEWSQSKIGQEGSNGLNYLTTSHEIGTERGMTHLINGQLKFGYTAREFNHNHPSNSPDPSGTYDHQTKGKAGTWGDIGFSNGVKSIFGE